MKLAWLCYEEDDNFVCGYDPNRAIVLFREPYKNYRYVKIVQIVYSEIDDGSQG
jgi:hypothetical protein